MPDVEWASQPEHRTQTAEDGGTGTMAADTSADSTGAQLHASPPVTRLRRPPWTDPRMLVGLLIVAGSVVLGARVVASADETQAVWSVREDHRAGTPVAADDLRTVDVRLDDNADRYVPADRTLEPGQVWARDVHSGELLGVSATRPADGGAFGELPVSVAAGAMPSDLAEGDRVDVWVGAAAGAQRSSADRVLEEMQVLSVAGAAASMGGEGGGHRVLLAVESDRPQALADALGAISSGQVTLVRRVGQEDR